MLLRPRPPSQPSGRALAAGDAPITTDGYEAADRKKTVLPEQLELRIQQHSEGSVGSGFNLLHLQKPLAVAGWEMRRRK
jgi:hypothetical protein